MISNEAILLTKHCVHAEFRYFRKNSDYWKIHVRDKIRFRSTFGFGRPIKMNHASSYTLQHLQ